jgi:hypothetical protein
MVPRCVEKQVPYTVCRMVPVQVCPTDNCSTCSPSSGVQEQESAKPAPTPDDGINNDNDPPKPGSEARRNLRDTVA